MEWDGAKEGRGVVDGSSHRRSNESNPLELIVYGYVYVYESLKIKASVGTQAVRPDGPRGLVPYRNDRFGAEKTPNPNPST